jgi:hypothetical protein
MRSASRLPVLTSGLKQISAYCQYSVCSELFRISVNGMNQTSEGDGVVLDLAQELGGVIDGSVVSVAMLGLLFLGWVIASQRRTNHVVELIRAMRRQR